MPQLITSTELDKFLGKHIKDICDCEYANDAHNHCAHFVSHVMGYKFGFTCKGMTGKGKGSGANIRVHEVFSKCKEVGEWDSATKPPGDCLAFVTGKSNVNLASKTMTNVPRKHIGIFCGNMIYHYSNSQRKVVKVTPAQFAHHYSGNDIKVYYGTFPII